MVSFEHRAEVRIWRKSTTGIQKVLEQLADISESLTKAAEDYSDGESAMLRSINRMVSETKLERDGLIETEREAAEEVNKLRD